MPILCCAIVDTPETLTITNKPLAVARTSIVVGKKRGTQFSIAEGESVEVRYLGDAIVVTDEDGHGLRFTRREFQALRKLCAVWRAVRIEFAAKVGIGSQMKWYPSPPLSYAAAGFRSVRELPLNHPDVAVIHDRFKEPRVVATKRRVAGLTVEHDIVTSGAERIGLVARDPDGNAVVITRRHLFVSYKRLKSVAKLVAELDHEPSVIDHGGIGLDHRGVAVVEAAAARRGR